MTDSVAVFDPGFRVLDANGEPVNNAKIKFRAAGPGATKTVYSDQGLSVALGHTVRTRSDGFPVISEGSSTTCLIYVGSDLYHIEITDEDDVAIYPAKDNVKGAVDTSDFLTSADASVLSKPVLTKTGNYTLTAADKGKVIDAIANGGFFTITLPDPTVVGDGWNAYVRNGGTANPVGLSSSANIHTPQGDMAAFSLRVGEAVSIACNGTSFKVDGYAPPLLMGTTGVIQITDRISSAPGSPVAGARYIVTAPFSTFEAEDIIEATGQGTFFEITPVADCGWIAYVVDEDIFYNFRGAAWVAETATSTQQGTVKLSTQAIMEAAAATDCAVLPAHQHFHPGHPKCWAYVTGSGTPVLSASYNITSITDTNTGILDITIATDFSSVNWCHNASAEQSNQGGEGGGVGVFCSTKAAGAITLVCEDGDEDAGNADRADPTAWNFAGFGDQA